MKTITVNLSSRSYPVYIGNKILSKDLLVPHIKGQQVLIVTQEKIAQFYLAPLQKLLLDFQCDVIFLQDGEDHKNLAEWQKILDALLQKSHDRTTTLIALGGGIVGDMAGFAAACYMRGVNYFQIPTSLIAQVDAAIGGKTGVNHPLGKNMVGAFYHPACVIIDTNFLQTLPQREFISGFAEVIKYGLIRDAEFFSWLEKNIQNILKKNSASLEYLVECSVKIKAEIVSQDECDLGVRNILNFGHTFGHALEAATAYREYLHGEAVAVGMVMAAKLSQKKGLCSAAELNRIIDLLTRCGLLQVFPQTLDFMSYMKRDKKNGAGEMNFILLKRIGWAVRVKNVAEDEAKSVVL